MSEDFYSKDYGDYFSKIEEKLNSPSKTDRKYSNQNNLKSRKKKRLFLVIKVNAVRALAVLIFALLVFGIFVGVKSCADNKKEGKTANPDNTVSQAENKTDNTKKNETKSVSFAKRNSSTLSVDADIKSQISLFIDDDSNTVIASRNSDKKAFPASTTKVMTLLVAVENITDLSDTFTMTYQITDPLYRDGATVAGFSAGEVITVEDMLYGTILPSGGDAAIGLAQKISGSEEAFVNLMNGKAKQLGLKNTHFTNCTGLHNDNHYTTAEDLAVIFRNALKNELCKKIISTYRFTTSKTDKHPEGILLENTIFKYMYGTEPETATILGGKTGFVNESGYCIVTYGKSQTDKNYVCVTLNGESRWPAVYDQINMYKKYAK